VHSLQASQKHENVCSTAELSESPTLNNSHLSQFDSGLKLLTSGNVPIFRSEICVQQPPRAAPSLSHAAQHGGLKGKQLVMRCDEQELDRMDLIRPCPQRG
jgi:hypothetical protein